MKTIKLPYSPYITEEKIVDILQREYPDKKVSRFLHLIRIKGNACRIANIKIYHSEKKNTTLIQVWLGMPFWMGMTIICPIVFVGLGAYAMLGKWSTEVAETLKKNYTKI